MWVVKIDLFFYWFVFLSAGCKWLGFCVGVRNLLDFGVGDRSFINELKRPGLRISVSTDGVAQCFIYNKGTKEVRVSTPTQVVFPLFLNCISTQQSGPKFLATGWFQKEKHSTFKLLRSGFWELKHENWWGCSSRGDKKTFWWPFLFFIFCPFGAF